MIFTILIFEDRILATSKYKAHMKDNGLSCSSAECYHSENLSPFRNILHLENILKKKSLN
jgi:hypothetical protein